MSARIKLFPGLYARINEEAMAAYAKRHPGTHPYDHDAQQLVKLIIYLWIWGDCYGENLWRLADDAAKQVKAAGFDDPILTLLDDLNADSSKGDYNGGEMLHHVASFAESEYPDELKMWTYQIAIEKAGSARTDPQSAALPDLVRHWGQLYEGMVRRPLPDTLLYEAANNLRSNAGGGTDVRTAIDGELKRAFAAAAPDSGVPVALEGRDLIDKAWEARSSDWANKVSSEQWKNFADLLSQADAVLEAGYEKHPANAEISTLMLTVELGQGQGRDRMEMWFQRAIKAEPENTDPYASKFWYLAPRWYGSEEDQVKFGSECLDGANVPPVALTCFTRAIVEQYEIDKDIYSRPEVWAVVEKAFHRYLNLYPQSTMYRTAFARHAAQSNRWKIVKEQLALLGNDWDRDGMTVAEHDADVQRANSDPTDAPLPPADSTPPQSPDAPTTFTTFLRVVEMILRRL